MLSEQGPSGELAPPTVLLTVPVRPSSPTASSARRASSGSSMAPSASWGDVNAGEAGCAAAGLRSCEDRA